jgi:hypothetical protein
MLEGRVLGRERHAKPENAALHGALPDDALDFPLGGNAHLSQELADGRVQTLFVHWELLDSSGRGRTSGDRKEELLTTDPVARDRTLSLAGHEPIHEGLPVDGLTWECRAGFTSMTPYWLKSRRSPSTSNVRSPRLRNEIHVPLSVRT